ncbi:MAG TPA: restriction endonuclease subunit S [Cellvibrionaceae bacterium]
MSKKSKKALVPELRFPEFQEAEKWQKIRLIDTADKKIKWSFIGGPFGSNLKSSDYVADGVRIIQLQNIGDAEFFDDYKIFTSEEKADELLANNIYPGEILLSKMGDPVGRACLIPTTHPRYVMCSDGIRLVVDEKIFSKYFIYTLINSVQFRPLVDKTATGSTRKRIGLDDLKNLPMVVPKKEEQEKIANCLSSIDDLIIAHVQNLDVIKSHKKGLIQQLFPAGGEAVPKLRFPGFRKDGKWTEYQLGQCLSRHPEYGINAPAVPYSDNLPTYLRITDISEDGLIRQDQKVSVAKEVTDENYLDEGDIVLARTGASVGKTYKYRAKDGRLVFAGFLIRVKPDAKKLNSELLFQFFSTEQYWHWVNLTSARSGQPGINGNEYSLLPIPLPPTLKEQQKIADFLLSIDEFISVHKQKIDALKAHKKGLMQQLFPVMDEVNE